MASCRKRAVTCEGQSNSVEVIRNKVKCSCSSIDAGEEYIGTYNINKCSRHWCSPFSWPDGGKKRLKSQRGIDMLVGEGLVIGHMGAARRVLGREGGTCWVPCSPVTLILSGGLTKRRTSCHSRRSFDVLLQSSHTPLQRSRGLFLFIMRIGGFVGEPVDKPHSGKKAR